jgi:hypothetical protein
MCSHGPAVQSHFCCDHTTAGAGYSRRRDAACGLFGSTPVLVDLPEATYATGHATHPTGGCRGRSAADHSECPHIALHDDPGSVSDRRHDRMLAPGAGEASAECGRRPPVAWADVAWADGGMERSWENRRSCELLRRLEDPQKVRSHVRRPPLGSAWGRLYYRRPTRRSAGPGVVLPVSRRERDGPAAAGGVCDVEGEAADGAAGSPRLPCRGTMGGVAAASARAAARSVG